MVPGYTGSYAVPSINPVSTIGAGDSFNAGIIHALLSHVTPSIEISDQQWNQIIAHATRFSSDVCMSFDNYISHDLADHLKRTSHERW
jgi:fructokinase